MKTVCRFVKFPGELPEDLVIDGHVSAGEISMKITGHVHGLIEHPEGKSLMQVGVALGDNVGGFSITIGDETIGLGSVHYA